MTRAEKNRREDALMCWLHALLAALCLSILATWAVPKTVDVGDQHRCFEFTSTYVRLLGKSRSMVSEKNSENIFFSYVLMLVYIHCSVVSGWISNACTEVLMG